MTVRCAALLGLVVMAAATGRRDLCAVAGAAAATDVEHDQVLLLQQREMVLEKPEGWPEKFTVIEHQNNSLVTYVDVGASGYSVGDYYIWLNDVYDEGEHRKIGKDQGSCTVVAVLNATAPEGLYQCVWTFFLDKGQLELDGPTSDVSDTVLSVTGGTGKYHEVTGQAPVHYVGTFGGISKFSYAFDLGCVGEKN